MSIAVLCVAFGSVLSVFLFALPQYRAANAGPTVDFATVPQHSVVDVRHAFALQGIDLRYGTHFSDVAEIASTPRPWPVSALYVFVGDRRGSANWGARDRGAYEAQFDNLLVHDGSTDPHELAAVKAAVATLR